MQCPRCQHENPGQKFCGECGTPLSRPVPTGSPRPSYADLERALREAVEQQTATAEILRAISSSPAELQPVLDTVVRSAARFCGAYDACIFGLDGDHLRLDAHHGPVAQPDGLLLPIVKGTVGGRTILERRVIHVADLPAETAEFPEAAPNARRLGFRTILSVPLIREGVAIGAIQLRRPESVPFTDEQVSLLKTFSDQAVIAIENVRLFTELQEKNRELTIALDQQTATADILKVISRSQTDVQPVFDAIAESALRLCEAKHGNVLLFDGELVHLAAVAGTDPEGTEVVRRSFPQKPGPVSATTRAILTRRPVVVPDVLEDPEYRLGEMVRAAAFRSVMSIPMLRAGDPIGAITVTRADAGPFSDTQLALLQTFADQAVIAVENVRLFKELAARNRDLTATGEILRVISTSPTNVQPVFDAIVESAVGLCEASNGTVFRFDGSLIHVAAHHGRSPEAIEVLHRVFPTTPDDRTLTGRAILTRTVGHVPDVLADPERRQRPLAETGSRAILSVPMILDGAPIGAISVTRPEPGPFSDDKIALLQTFADQAVIAIQNVGLFTELQEKNRALTEALEQQTATSEILRTIAHAQTDVQPVFDTIVRSAARLCHAPVAGVFLTDGRTVHHLANYGTSPEQLAATRLRYPRPVAMDSSPGMAILTRSVFQVQDTEDPSVVELVRQLGRALGFRSSVAVPMLREGEAVGAIIVNRREPGRFSDGEVALLNTFADQAVIAVENVRLFKELQEKNRALTESLEQQTATAEILRIIAQAQTDAQPVFETIVQSAARLCRASNAAVFLTDGRMVSQPANYGSTPETLAAARAAYPRPLDRDSIAGLAILTRSLVHLPDIEDPSAGALARELGRLLGVRSTVSVPMLREGEAIGTINVARREAGRFSDGEIALLNTFADQAAIAIENARLFRELKERTHELTRSVEQLTALGEVVRAVSSTLDLETVLTTIVARAVQLSGLDGGVVFEYDEGAEEFVQRAATETAGALAEARRTMRIRKGEGVVGRTALTLEPVQVPDITAPGAHGGRLRETLIASGVRAILAVPMLRETRLIGSLGVTRDRPGEFPPETIELLRTFATQSALAIQNARLFAEIADKSRQLEAASRHKSEFLANMSHELRTPLNAVIGFSEVLLQRMFGELNDKQDEYLKDIYASGQHLLSLINDILDLSKIEAGRMELAAAPFHLPSALENSLTLVRERAGRHGIALQLDIDSRLGQIVGDERKIKQVLLNLLSNAVKFTQEGGRVSLKAGRKDDAVEIAVTDTGIGIAPEDQAAIFEEFRQVGTDETRKQEGTGLGLTLAKKFVELHGGRIWVESEPDRGSTFVFTLPLR
jgi:GAF domain-containing protein